MTRSFKIHSFIFAVLLTSSIIAAAQNTRTVAGTVVTPRFELVPGVTVEIRSSEDVVTGVSYGEGKFTARVAEAPLTVSFSGKNIAPLERQFSAADKTDGLQVKINYVVPPISESVTIQAEALTPDIEYRNDSVYKNTLFGRDDQLVQTLNAGINAGQHEGVREKGGGSRPGFINYNEPYPKLFVGSPSAEFENTNAEKVLFPFLSTSTLTVLESSTLMCPRLH
jgi:hypothetical protein